MASLEGVGPGGIFAGRGAGRALAGCLEGGKGKKAAGWASYYRRRPSSWACATAWVRLAAPSLPRMWLTCFLAVSSATTSCLAICLFAMPAASNPSTSSSRSVSGSANPATTTGAVGLGEGGALAPGVPGEYLGRLRAAFQPGDGRAAPPSPRPTAPVVVAGLAEPLTDRELEVLGLLAVGMANKQIAKQLVVALETAKKHVSHILGKLGAANRTQAVARAHALGLLR